MASLKVIRGRISKLGRSRNQTVFASIFFDFALPNAATWFYFSFLLALAIFFKFDRILTIRNWDLVGLFLLVPGLLLIQEAHAYWAGVPLERREAELARAAIPEADRPVDQYTPLIEHSRRTLPVGYIWLMAGTGLLFLRCLFDLGLEKRPTISPNLNLPGLAWLSAALFISLTVVAFNREPDQADQIGRGPVVLTKVQDGAIAVVRIQSGEVDPDRETPAATVSRAIAMAVHLSIVLVLILIGVKRFQDPPAGVGMACIYLMLPYTGYHVSQLHHVWPAAMMLWAVYCYERPRLAGGMLGIAAGSAFFPFLAFPAWLGFYRERGAGRFASGFALTSGLSLALTATVLFLSGELRQYLYGTLSLSDWQPWKAPRTEGLWTGSHWAYRLPVFIVYAAFVVLTAFWPKPRNLGHVIALTAAVVIGVQFWYADQGGVYVLWYLPIVLLMVFRPSLVDVRPPPLKADQDWVMVRIARAAGRWWTRPGAPTKA